MLHTFSSSSTLTIKQQARLERNLGLPYISYKLIDIYVYSHQHHQTNTLQMLNRERLLSPNSYCSVADFTGRNPLFPLSLHCRLSVSHSSHLTAVQTSWHLLIGRRDCAAIISTSTTLPYCLSFASVLRSKL